MTNRLGMFLFFNIVIFGLAYQMQTHLLLNPDASYLMHAAKQMLLGGAYGAEIFETNPPMILYLYMPVLWLQKYTGFAIETTFRFYVFILAFASSTSCYFLLNKIINASDDILKNFIYGAILLSLLFLPVSSFGQREHLLMIFILPYVFLVVLRLQGQTLSFLKVLGIGIFAGLGFALKPFFLVTLCLIELYGIYQKRNLFNFLRIETVVIAAILLFYLASIFYLQSGYLHNILPFVLKYYFPVYKMAWIDIPRVPFVRFILAILLGYLIFIKMDIYPILGRVLWLGIIGMMIAMLIPRSPSYYHLLPALSFALILSCNYLGQCLIFFKKTHNHMIVLATGLMMFSPLIFDGVRVFYAISYFHEKTTQQKIAHFIKTQSTDHSLLCLSLKTLPCFPLVNTVQGDYTGRFPLLWWYEGIKKIETQNTFSVEKDKNKLMHWAIEDITSQKAKWVVVSDNLLPYFLMDENFRVSFKNYIYRTSIADKDIYERVSKNI